MKAVNTVLGPVSSGDLGKTLMHEHFLFGFCGFQGDITLGGFDEDAAFRVCRCAAKRAKAFGIKTVVDATTNECGRDPLFLRRLSSETGINIICSTGYYFEAESAFSYWRFRSAFSDVENEIYEMMKSETTVGIAGTGVQAGVIKLASSLKDITQLESMFFRAAARLSSEAGTPIITHTQGGTMGPEQAELLIRGGAAPEKIAIGHMCGNTDPAYHEAVLSQGVFDAFDRFGLEGEAFNTPTDEERADLLATLVHRGWEDQLLMSQDSVAVELGRPRPVPREDLESMRHANIDNIGVRVLGLLTERGVTSAQIEKILTANPSRLLG